MKYMKTCCYSCCTVETGTKVLSILGAISCVSQLFGTIASALKPEDETLQKLPINAYDFLVSHAVFSAIGLFVSILCAVGAFQRRRNFLIPYLVYQGIILVELAVVSILCFVFGGILASVDLKHDKDGFQVAQAIIVPIVISLAVAFLVAFFLVIYYLIVVLSYYKELEASERNPQPAVAYSGVPSNAPPGYPPPQGYPQGGAPPGYGPQGGFYPSLPEQKGDVV